jgi:hypothetical protein
MRGIESVGRLSQVAQATTGIEITLEAFQAADGANPQEFAANIKTADGQRIASTPRGGVPLLATWVARSARSYRRSNWSRPESIARITAKTSGAHRFNV